MNLRPAIVVSAAVSVLAWAPVSRADESAKSFESTVGPVLSAKCLGCHSPGISKGGLDLSTRASLLKGGEGGPALVPGKPEESPVYVRAVAPAGQKPEMPEKGEPLTPDEAALLRDWISAGAVWPEKLVLKEKSRADASFWSFQPIKAVEPPAAVELNPSWTVHPIDRFVGASLLRQGLAPNPPADPRTFIRRATFDLWGLPPAFEEVRDFERDCRESRTSPEDVLPAAAVQRLIDRLLASPHYGEHWGRHWLDVVRFGESRGYERNEIITNLWPFRIT